MEKCGRTGGSIPGQSTWEMWCTKCHWDSGPCSCFIYLSPTLCVPDHISLKRHEMEQPFPFSLRALLAFVPDGDKVSASDCGLFTPLAACETRLGGPQSRTREKMICCLIRERHADIPVAQPLACSLHLLSYIKVI